MPKTQQENTTEVKTTQKAVRAAKGTLKINVLDKSGKVAKEMELPKEIFGTTVNKALMAQAVRVYLANQRQGTSSTKTRGQVTASTKKVYKQKGTGRARHGAVSAPIYVGGGIAFGPKPRDFSLKLSKKMKRNALFSALSMQLGEQKILVVEGLNGVKGKTKEIAAMFNELKLQEGKKKSKILFVLPEKVDVVERASRNIEGVVVEKAANLHTYEVLNNHYILFMEEALPVLSKTFLEKEDK